MPKLKPQPTVLDRIGETSPLYRNLLIKHRELLDRAEEIKREIGGNATWWHTVADSAGNVTARRYEESLGAEFVRNKTWEDDTPRRRQQKPEIDEPDERQEAAKALLGNLMPEQPPEEINPPPRHKRWPGQDRYNALAKESDAIQVALGYISRPLEEARREYSKKLVEQRKDEYAERAEAVVDAARALGDAIQSHYQYLDELRLAGVEWRRLRPLNLERYGDLAEPHTPLLQTILDAIELGHVGAGKIPDWRLPANIQLFQ